jgi:TonB family protein
MTMLADVAIRTSIVLAAGLIARAAVRRRSASLRHRVLAMTMLATATIAPVSWLLPAWAVPVPTISLTADRASHDASQPIGTSVSVTATNRAPESDSGLPLMVWLWALGAAANGAVLLLGIARLARLTRRATPLDDARWRQLAEQARADAGVTRTIELLETDTSDVLATWGFLRPRLLVPRHAGAWEDERVRIVLRHELAHIRRNDWIVQMAAEALRCIYWFNPLVWVACRQLRQDSEHACDDEVLEAGAPPRTCATHLLELARMCRRPSPTWASAMLMAYPSTLERRIAAMLDPNLDRTPASRRAIATVAALIVCIALPSASLRARQTSPLPLEGSVYDPTGAVMPDVELTLEGANETAATTRTDASGRFEFPAIAPGRYVLSASLPGFKTLRYDIELRTSRDWDRAITLQVGDVQETITVEAERLPNADNAAAKAPLRVGGNIKAPLKVHDVHPTYPDSMRAAGREGVVPIEAMIGRDGHVASARVVSAQVHPDFAAAALDAVRQWQFTPTLLNGKPVDVVMTVSVTFKLAN